MQQECSLVSEVFFALCKGIDTPVSLGNWLRFKYAEHAQLCEKKIDPRMYSTADSFHVDYIVTSFLSKSKSLDTKIDLKAVALQSFQLSEKLCHDTNVRLKNSRISPIKEDVAAVIKTAQRKISSLLGPFSCFKVNSEYGWGPGATSDLPKRRAFVDTKVSELPISVTRLALPLIKAEIEHDHHWSCVILDIPVTDLMGPYSLLRTNFDVVEGCTIKTVPKSAKTDRTIAVEPRANGFLQKGAGSFIRKRLKSVGIDLDSQEANQEGAQRALTDNLCTIDISSASDSVAIELVYELLPVDWAFALDDIRSHKAVMPNGDWVRLNKFSSMGNGFTFELETLLFWAISSSVDERLDSRNVLIYGDDIVAGQECYPLLVESLNFLGFQVNQDKSFSEGLFFESCGMHYFNGYDVTPVYQKNVIDSTEELIRLGNRLMRLAARISPGILDPRILPAWHASRRYDPDSHRFFIPLGAEGDDGWAIPSSLLTSPFDPNKGLRCRVLRPTQISYPANVSALLAWTLRRGVKTESPYGGDVKTSREPSLGFGTRKASHRWIYPTEKFALN